MNFTITRKQDKLYVFVSGEIDHHNAALIRESVDIEIKRTKTKELVFDFSQLEMMDSSGIGILMGRLRLMQQTGGKTVVSGAPEYIEKIIVLSGLGNLIELRKGA